MLELHYFQYLGTDEGYFQSRNGYCGTSLWRQLITMHTRLFYCFSWPVGISMGFPLVVGGYFVKSPFFTKSSSLPPRYSTYH